MRRTISIGHEDEGLYHLDVQIDSAGCSGINSFLTHYRLSHPSIQSLRLLLPEFRKLSILNCESYQLGKQHCVSYPLRSNTRASSPLNFFIQIIWSPCPNVQLNQRLVLGIS